MKYTDVRQDIVEAHNRLLQGELHRILVYDKQAVPFFDDESDEFDGTVKPVYTFPTRGFGALSLVYVPANTPNQSGTHWENAEILGTFLVEGRTERDLTRFAQKKLADDDYLDRLVNEQD